MRNDSTVLGDNTLSTGGIDVVAKLYSPTLLTMFALLVDPVLLLEPIE
jgi:hypothetical protein